MKRTPEQLAKYREDYPTKCARCGDDLEGAPEDEELDEQLEEHDRLFPGQPISTTEVICDSCFQTICPGGKVIGFN